MRAISLSLSRPIRESRTAIDHSVARKALDIPSPVLPPSLLPSLFPSFPSLPPSAAHPTREPGSLSETVWTLYDSSQLTSLFFHGPHSHFVIRHPSRLFAYKGGRRRPMGMQRRDISGSRGLKGARVKRRTHTVPFLHHSHFAGRGRLDPRVHDSSSVHPRQDCRVSSRSRL